MVAHLDGDWRRNAQHRAMASYDVIWDFHANIYNSLRGIYQAGGMKVSFAFSMTAKSSALSASHLGDSREELESECINGRNIFQLT